MILFKRPGPQRLATATGKMGQTSVCTSLTLRSLIGHLPTQQDLELDTYHPKAALEELAMMTCLFEPGIQMNYGKNLEVKVSDDHKFTPETQRIILRLILASRGIAHLRLLNFSVLNDTLLEQLIRSNSTTLKSIDLRGCPAISFKPILAHYSRLSQVEEIQMSGSALGNFCLNDRQAVPFPKLKKLLIQTHSKSERIVLHAPALKSLKIIGDPKITLEGNPSLRSLVWKGGKDISLPHFNSENLQELVLEKLRDYSKMLPISMNGLRLLSMTNCVLDIEHFTHLITEAPLKRLRLHNPTIHVQEQYSPAQICAFIAALLKTKNLDLCISEQQTISQLLTRCAEMDVNSILNDLEINRFIASLFFGKAKWKKYFGDIGEEPPLPPNIVEILTAPCPFDPDQKVFETHMLVLVPETVNGEPLTMNSLVELMQRPREGHAMKCGYFDGDHGITRNSASHSVLMTKDCVPGTQGKSYAEQQNIVTILVPKYQVPALLGATVCILMEHVESGRFLFPHNTRCQEKNEYNQLSVGLSNFGLFVYDCCENDYQGIGLGALRKF